MKIKGTVRSIYEYSDKREINTIIKTDNGPVVLTTTEKFPYPIGSEITISISIDESRMHQYGIIKEKDTFEILCEAVYDIEHRLKKLEDAT